MGSPLLPQGLQLAYPAIFRLRLPLTPYRDRCSSATFYDQFCAARATSSASSMSRHSSKWAKPRSMRRVQPRSSQMVERERLERNRRSWLIITNAVLREIKVPLQPFDSGQSRC